MDVRFGYRLLSLFGVVAGALVFGSLTAVWLVHWLPADSVLLEKGAPKLARRCMMLWGLILAPVFVVAMDCFQRGDHGWSPWSGYGLRRRRLHLAVAGLLLGLLSLGTIMALSLLHGSRLWHVSYPGPKLTWKLGIEYPLKAGVVAVFEETVMRGYLLRGLCRGFGAWPAIVLSSGLFAALHFIHPAADSFYGSGVINDSSRVLASGVMAFLEEPGALPQFVNLFLMSAFLCLLTLRTGTIWPAAGVHAGWVWVRMANGVLADRNPHEAAPWIFGTRSAHLDAIVTSLVLLLLCVAVAMAWHRATTRESV